MLIFEIRGAVSNKPASEIYQLINCHITDGADHNKGFAAIISDIFNLDTQAGQLFCGTHASLGFSSALNKVVTALEP